MINQPNEKEYSCGVLGLENAELLKISFEDFEDIMSEDFNLSKNCMMFMEYRIRSLYRQLKNSVTINMEKKLAAKLYRLGTEYGKKTPDDSDYTYIELNITNTYLSKMLGCQRETVSRSMKSLSDRKVIKTEGRKVYIDMKLSRKLFKGSD